MEMPAASPEHQWLLQLVGDWEFEGACEVGPDQPPLKSSGTQSTRALGDLWTIGEMQSEYPNGMLMKSIMTLGFDPVTKRFVGTFVASCTTHLWQYVGQLDADRKVLTLDADGPSFMEEGKITSYQDIVEVIDHDHYLFSSRVRDASGNWISFMQSQYKRVGVST